LKIAYFDCIAGASGDMILGALIDAGLTKQSLLENLSALRLPGFELKFKQVKKSSFAATKVDVIVSNDVPERHLSDIKRIIDESDLPKIIKDQSIRIFQKLCEVEAGIHDSSPEKVHLHELGGVDTIVDVVGVLSGIAALDIKKVFSSPLPMTRGFINGAHGRIPLPAPATIALLKDVPITGSEIEAELVTPTGAVLLTSLAENFGPIPKMSIQTIGYGAGEKDLSIPNVLRLFIGEESESKNIITENLVLLETNIDDQNPEIYDYVMAKLFATGALDVYLTPIQMKKNRPATTIHVLCSSNKCQIMEEILFAETSTLGIRKQEITRHSLPREFQNVKTKYGEVKIKISKLENGLQNVAPEYEDCRRLAESNNVPIKEIYFEAENSARKNLNSL
jgi:uncharacterized protein (TIGR00299 family) protein